MPRSGEKLHPFACMLDWLLNWFGSLWLPHRVRHGAGVGLDVLISWASHNQEADPYNQEADITFKTYQRTQAKPFQTALLPPCG